MDEYNNNDLIRKFYLGCRLVLCGAASRPAVIPCESGQSGKHRPQVNSKHHDYWMPRFRGA